MKRRIMLVVDDDHRQRVDLTPLFIDGNDSLIGVTVESVEDLPEPMRVQEFRVRVETEATAAPIRRASVEDVLNGRDSFVLGNVRIASVTEVDPT